MPTPKRPRATKAKTQPHPVYPDALKPIPAVPEADALLQSGMAFTPEEKRTVEIGKNIAIAARRLKLTLNGWRHIAEALEVGERKAKELAGGRDTTPSYNIPMGKFLNATTLAFIGKNDRTALRQLLPVWDEFKAWYGTLTPQRRQDLNEPRPLRDAFLKDSEPGQDPAEKPWKKFKPGYKPPRPDHLERMQALEELAAVFKDRAVAAESQSAYFEALSTEYAVAAGLSDEVRAAARLKARAAVDALRDDGDDEE